MMGLAKHGGCGVALLIGALSCAPRQPRQAAPPPAAPDACSDARAATRAAGLLREGRIARAITAFERVPAACKSELGDAWGEAVVALAELGRADAARTEAQVMALAANASPAAQQAARRALEHLSRFGKSGGDQAVMLEVYDRALAQERAGQREPALASYLEAWERFRPNPQALIRAAQLAQTSGDAARARRLRDRALVELAPSVSTQLRASTWTLGELDSVWLQWLPGARSLGVCLGRRLQIIDAATLEPLASYRIGARRLAFSSDGRQLALPNADDSTLIEVFHARSGHRVASFRTESVAKELSANPSFTRLAIGTEAGKVEVFALPEGRRVARFDAGKYPRELSFLDDSLLWGSFDSGERHFGWDIQKGTLLWELAFPDHSSTDRVDDRLVYMSRRGKKHYELGPLDLRSGRRGKPLVIRQELDDLAALSRDVVAVAGGGKVTAYDWNALKPLATTSLDTQQIELRAHRPGSVLVAYHPRGKAERLSRIWTPSSGELMPYAPPAAAMPTPVFGPALAESATGSIAYLKDPDTLVVRSVEGRERQLVRARPAELTGVAVLPEGSGLVVGDGRGIRLLSFRAPALGWLGGRGLPSSNLGFSHDGRWLLATGSRLVVLDAKTGSSRRELERAGVLDARISSDGHQVVAVDAEGSLIWDLRTGKAATRQREDEAELGVAPRTSATCCGGTFTLGPGASAYIAGRSEQFVGAEGLSADGKRLAIAHHGVVKPPTDDGDDDDDDDDDDGDDDDDARPGAIVFDVASRKVVRELSTKGTHLTAYLNELVLDATGRRAAASDGFHGLALLWDVEENRRFELGSARELSFSSDGKLLVAVDDSSAALWRTSDGQKLGAFVLSRQDPDSGAFIAEDGRVEWIGKPGGVHLSCSAGTWEVPFEVCADRLLEPGLSARTLR